MRSSKEKKILEQRFLHSTVKSQVCFLKENLSLCMVHLEVNGVKTSEVTASCRSIPITSYKKLVSLVFLKGFLRFFTVGSPCNSLCMYYAYLYLEKLFEISSMEMVNISH